MSFLSSYFSSRNNLLWWRDLQTIFLDYFPVRSARCGFRKQRRFCSKSIWTIFWVLVLLWLPNVFSSHICIVFNGEYQLLCVCALKSTLFQVIPLQGKATHTFIYLHKMLTISHPIFPIKIHYVWPGWISFTFFKENLSMGAEGEAYQRLLLF